jgi:hypothetical protein
MIERNALWIDDDIAKIDRASMSESRATISSMPAKDPEKRRATVRAWYARTKKEKRTPKVVARQTAVKRARLHKLMAWFVELKETFSCRRCGETHPATLQFHHRDPSLKEISVALAIRRAWSQKRILAEVEKCEVLCANCHAKHHAREARDAREAREARESGKARNG